MKALIIAGLLASLPVDEGVSLAQPTIGTPSAGISFESSFRAAFQASAQQLLTCLANDTGARTRTILFIGIPQSDTHFAESQRRALNSIAVKVINGTGLFRAAQVEGIDRVAPALERRSADALRQTLARNYDAPAIVTFRTHRPDIDVVQLNLLIFGRGEQATYDCTDSASLLLDPRTLKTRPRPAVDLDLTSLHGAYADGLSKLSHGIRRQKSLAVSIATELPGHCGLKAAIAADFETVLFDRRRSASVLDVAGKAEAWPAIVSGQASRPDEARLTLSLAPSRIDPRILNLKLALKRDGIAIDSAGYRVVVPLLLLAGCEPPPEKPPVGRLSLSADKVVYGQDEAIFLDIEATAPCRLTLVNIDSRGRSCLLFPHPQLENRPLEAGIPFTYPPTGRMRAGSDRIETFVALCNARPEALATEINATRLIDCSRNIDDPSFGMELETVILDLDDPSGSPGPGSQADRSGILSDADLLRQAISVRIRP